MKLLLESVVTEVRALEFVSAGKNSDPKGFPEELKRLA